MTKLVNIADWINKMIKQFDGFILTVVVLKLCIVSLQMITMTKGYYLFDFHNMAFKNFQMEVANRKTFIHPQSLLPFHKLKFLIKMVSFFMPTKFCMWGYYSGKAVKKTQCVENHRNETGYCNTYTWNF